MPNHQSVALLNNTRFYILLSSILGSLFAVGLLRILIESDQLYYIRLQQLMGLSSLVFWYIALIISPLTYIFGKQRLCHVTYARRAIGVSAAYFAILHLCIALWGQLGGFDELTRLPTLMQQSLLLGGIATVILVIMTLTSFDAVVKYMTYARWKLLHRLTYVAFILVVIHIWMIGTHVTYSLTQTIALISLLLLAGLESYRLLMNLNKKWHFIDGTGGAIVLVVVLLTMWFAAIASIPRVFDNYHSRNHGGVHGQ